MKGARKLKQKYINEWNNKLSILKQQIEYWISPLNKTNKMIEAIQLYFDNFEVSNIIINNNSVIQSQLLKKKLKNKKSIIDE